MGRGRPISILPGTVWVTIDAAAPDLADERRISLALEAASVWVWDWDPRTDLIAWPSASTHFFGPEPISLESFSNRLHPEDRVPVVQAFSSAVQTGSFSTDFRLVGPDGAVRWVMAQGRALPGGAEPAHLAGIMVDVTASREERAERGRLKDDALAAAAHDLKTPLTTIKGTTHLLRRRLDRSEPLDLDRLRTSLARIDGTATKMAATVNGLLDMVRGETGEPLNLSYRPIDLVALVSQVVGEHQQTADHAFIVTTAVPSLVGRWDGFRLERVLTNLLSNAVKYSPFDSRILITLDRDGSHALLSVTDAGMGIPADDLPRIFDRFYRGSNVDTTKVRGAGVGLAAVRQIVEEHGGTIDVRSREGAGTTFTLRLPLSRRATS